MNTTIKKVILYSVISVFGAVTLASYTQPVVEDSKTETTQVITKAGQLITVTFAGHCADMVQTAITETFKEEFENYDQTDLDTISAILIEYADEKGCTVNKLKLTLIGVGM